VSESSSIGLAYEFTYHALLEPPVAVGAGPYGTRVYYEYREGTATGDRISGKVLTGGGDWLLLGADGYGRIDVRVQIATDDGAFLYGVLDGLIEMNDAVQRASEANAETAYGDQYFRTAARFETGDERYAWVNRCLFVAEGRVHPGLGVEHRVHRLT
jgi:hypothetical protein